VTLSNREVAAALHEIGDLLEIKGESRFRILGYRRAAESIAGASKDVCDMAESQLTGLAGVGKGVAARVAELCKTGKIESLETLRAQVPPTMREMTMIPGLGPKGAMAIYSTLGISTLEELKKAAEEQRLRDVPGLGAKTEEQILAALERGVEIDQRVLLARALPLAEAMLADLDTCDAVVRSAYAGSMRRMRETVGDIDLLVASDRPTEVMEHFRSMRGVRESKADGPTKSSVLTTDGLQVDLRVIEPDVFGAALQYFTGSQAHNVKIRANAVRRKLKLSEYGLFDAKTDERLVAATEEEVYDALGMQWVPPTMREDKGEVEAALDHALPRVIVETDMRGDLQSHSTYSDGRLPVRDMAVAAQAKGYEYYAVTDHGRRLTYIRNLSLSEIDNQRAEIAELNKELKITVLHGVELNIAADGSLDYPDEVLAGFDICVASIHGQFNLSKKDQTKRLITAIEDPHVHVIGHPSGRRLDRRPGIDFDVAEVAKAAAEHGVALEINAHPYRLDLRDEHIRWAREHGVFFAVSTDAHSIAELDHMRFGIATAQRGWVEPDEVINTWPLERLRAFLRKAG
jgi:DNA polymerase (family 10)